MTNPHAKAVEAAALAVVNAERARFELPPRGDHVERDIMDETAYAASITAISAYLAAMRAEGWVMVRDVGGTQPATVPWRYGDAWDGIQDGVGIGTLDALCNGYADGWNACRATMLKGAGDGQG